MTTAAIRAELTIVDIVRTMTAATAAIDHLHVGQRTAVAALAAHVGVCALQRKFCLDIVVEGPEIPCDRVVAGIAVFCKSSFMAVVLRMA